MTLYDLEDSKSDIYQLPYLLPNIPTKPPIYLSTTRHPHHDALRDPKLSLRSEFNIRQLDQAVIEESSIHVPKP